MRPKKNGGWDKPFDPKEVNNNFTEGNAWQYTFFVPQDIPGMIEAYGGNEKFEAKLDEMFNSESKTTGREQVDVTGLIGQYAHGNEPSHHMAYLYNYVGKPEKTNEKVKYILENFYKNTPDGLIGNEDCGQMSAWYVLSSMGIYNVTPGFGGYWSTTEPSFKNTIVNREDKKRGIKTSFKETYTDFGFEKENLKWEIYPPMRMILPVPVIETESKSFKDKLKVEVFSRNPEDEIYYIINEKNVDYLKDKRAYIPYSKPFYIDKSSTIVAFVKGDNKISNLISAQFFKKPNNFTIDIKGKYNPQYHAGGDDGLIDGIYGNENWRKGEWQGFQNQNFECVVDMQSARKISSITSNYLQDTRSWILMPTKVDYYVSEDNITFKKVGTVKNVVNPKEYVTVIKPFELKFKAQKARYVKVIATNFGKLPEWHQGFPSNGDAFVFVDEITIK